MEWTPTAPCNWSRPKTGYYDEQYLPKKLTRVGEDGSLYFDDGIFPWKLADDFAEDPRWGYPRWKVMLGKLTGKGEKVNVRGEDRPKQGAALLLRQG